MCHPCLNVEMPWTQVAAIPFFEKDDSNSIKKIEVF